MAPSLQQKCNQLKRARLVDHLNEVLAKRPGPLELVESGILVSSDSSLTEAIKDGKIVYPRTSSIAANSKLTYHNYAYPQPNGFSLDESNLNSFNFNFSNLTDNEDSNTSQSSSTTTKTNNTISSSSMSSFNFIGNSASNNLNTSQASPSPAGFNNGEIINFGDMFQSSSNAPSPASSISTTIVKSSPVSSPFPSANFEFTASGDANKPASSKTSAASLKKSSSSKSCSSPASVSSSKSNKSNSNANKKLIIHYYNGPNQKSSKSCIDLKPKFSRTNTNTSANSLTNKPSAKQQHVEPASAQTKPANTELFDESTNLNADFELNDYEIRLEQQKVFLLFNEQNENEVVEPTIEPKTNEISSTSSINDTTLVNSNNNDEMLASNSADSQILLSNLPEQYQAQFQTNNSVQPIQLVSIGDFQMLDNLKNLGLVPIRTISFNNNNEEQTQIDTNSSNLNQSSNLFNGQSSIKIINASTLINNSTSQNQTNIYSLDSETGQLKPFIIAHAPSAQQIQQASYQSANGLSSQVEIKKEDSSAVSVKADESTAGLGNYKNEFLNFEFLD